MRVCNSASCAAAAAAAFYSHCEYIHANTAKSGGQRRGDYRERERGRTLEKKNHVERKTHTHAHHTDNNELRQHSNTHTPAHIHWLWLWLCWVVSSGKHRTYTHMHTHKLIRSHSYTDTQYRSHRSGCYMHIEQAATEAGKRLKKKYTGAKKVVENCVCLDLLLETTVLKRTLCRSHRMYGVFTECVTESKRREEGKIQRITTRFVFIYLYTISFISFNIALSRVCAVCVVRDVIPNANGARINVCEWSIFERIGGVEHSQCYRANSSCERTKLPLNTNENKKRYSACTCRWWWW